METIVVVSHWKGDFGHSMSLGIIGKVSSSTYMCQSFWCSKTIVIYFATDVELYPSTWLFFCRRQAVAASFLSTQKGWTVIKLSVTSMAPLSVSKLFGIPYGSIQLLRYPVLGCFNETLAIEMTQVSFEQWSVLMTSCWILYDDFGLGLKCGWLQVQVI